MPDDVGKSTISCAVRLRAVFWQDRWYIDRESLVSYFSGVEPSISEWFEQLTPVEAETRPVHWWKRLWYGPTPTGAKHG